MTANPMKSFLGFEDLVATGGEAVVETTISSVLCDLVELGDVRPENIRKFRIFLFDGCLNWNGGSDGRSYLDDKRFQISLLPIL